MLRLDPAVEKTSTVHSYLLSAIAPRPIAFASTIDKEGNPNLSPFSFFNCFSANPPTIIFSPARRVRDNTVKHTLENIYEVDEVVINVVNYDIVQQASLASSEFPKGTNEFLKAGFTPIASEKIRPFRVKESPVQMECKVKQVIELGEHGGAGNLIICEVLLMHISEDILNADKKIDANKIDLVARMGGDLYCRASGSSIFEIAKPHTQIGIGIDQLPEKIKNSQILTGNNLGQLGNVEKIPGNDELLNIHLPETIESKLQTSNREKLHFYAKEFLDNGEVLKAWKILLTENN